jgi:hypothetical protein
MYIHPSLPIGVLDQFGRRLHLFLDGALVPISNRLRFLLLMTYEFADHVTAIHRNRLRHERSLCQYYFKQSLCPILSATQTLFGVISFNASAWSSAVPGR